MIINDIYFTLKDGRNVSLRCPKEDDVLGALDYVNLSASETDYIYRSSEDCVRYTYESEKCLFETVNASDDHLMLFCIVDGKIAGNCEIVLNYKAKTRHRASIAIALLKDYWGQGLGVRMLDELIIVARQIEYVSQIEIKLIEGNTRGRAMYEKRGFRICSVIPDGICLSDGTRLNEYIMMLKL
ncbi:MAG: GNAT family N-acetyltransferase [Clostridia bacterium]|nr:GNAT family N-acetyltransferase [Clostridia bacterium]